MNLNVKNSSDFLRVEDLLYVAKFKSLYKYMSVENGIRLLKDYTLNFNSPLNFNDPYDCDPSLIVIGEDFILKTIKKEPRFKHLTSNKNFKNSNTYLTTVANFRKVKSKIIREKILSKVGITCFSERMDNLLMWSHYARNHNGICIDFDTERLIDYFSQINTGDKPKSGFFLVVKYDFIRENYNYNGTEDSLFSLLLWLKTKSIDWEYEKEIRFIIPRWDNTDMLIPSNVIKSIYLGSRITPEYERQIKSICKTNFPNALIYKMKLSEEEYNLKAIKIL